MRARVNTPSAASTERLFDIHPLSSLVLSPSLLFLCSSSLIFVTCLSIWLHTWQSKRVISLSVFLVHMLQFGLESDRKGRDMWRTGRQWRTRWHWSLRGPDDLVLNHSAMKEHGAEPKNWTRHLKTNTQFCRGEQISLATRTDPIRPDPT